MDFINAHARVEALCELVVREANKYSAKRKLMQHSNKAF